MCRDNGTISWSTNVRYLSDDSLPYALDTSSGYVIGNSYHVIKPKKFGP